MRHTLRLCSRHQPPRAVLASSNVDTYYIVCKYLRYLAGTTVQYIVVETLSLCPANIGVFRRTAILGKHTIEFYLPLT